MKTLDKMKGKELDQLGETIGAPRDKYKCHMCKKEVRTMLTSDKGLLLSCINPLCVMAYSEPVRPPIDKLKFKMRWNI
jgi:hypothetical protein